MVMRYGSTAPPTVRVSTITSVKLRARREISAGLIVALPLAKTWRSPLCLIITPQKGTRQHATYGKGVVPMGI